MEPTVNQFVERRLSDLLDKGDGRGPDVLFADRAAVAAAVEDGHDPQLYYAVRDVLPRRVAMPASAAGFDRATEGVLWAADLVVYQHGTLPDGEPVRSIGHWNPVDQLEIFQVLSGRVLLITCLLGDSDDESYVSFQECEAGDLAVVPFGAWHLTAVLDGPAMVFNTYSGPAGAGGHGMKSDAGADMSGKYRSQRGPAEIVVTRSDAGYDLALSPRLRSACGDPVRVTCPGWLRAYLPASGMLTDLHVSGSDADLEALLRMAHVQPDAMSLEAVEL